MTADQAILLSILIACWSCWSGVAGGMTLSRSVPCSPPAYSGCPQSELFSGFGNPATITVVLVLIVSYGLTKSGAVDYLIPLIEPASRHPFCTSACSLFWRLFSPCL